MMELTAATVNDPEYRAIESVALEAISAGALESVCGVLKQSMSAGAINRLRPDLLDAIRSGIRAAV
jgi:hypothetical protein